MNEIRITLQREQKLNKDFSPMEESNNSVYINCNEISSWIGYANNTDELMQLIAPENLSDTINVSLSETESNIFQALLKDGTCYSFYDEKFIYKY